MKGKIGVQLSLKTRSPLRRNKVLEAEYLIEQAKKTAVMSHQPTKINPRKRRDSRCRLTDEQFALIRGDFEIRNKPIKQICADRLLEYADVYNVLSYKTRAYVEPK